MITDVMEVQGRNHAKEFPNGNDGALHLFPLKTQCHSTEEQWHKEKYNVSVQTLKILSIMRQTDPQTGFGVTRIKGGDSMWQKQWGAATHVVCSHTS